MKLVAKIKAWVGLAVLGAGALVAYNVFQPGLGMDRRDEQVQIRLGAEAEPGVARGVVIWQTTRTMPATEFIEGSVWVKIIMVHVGDTVVMSVSRNSSGDISCWIMRGLQEVVPRKAFHPPGTISCHYVVTG